MILKNAAKWNRKKVAPSVKPSVAPSVGPGLERQEVKGKRCYSRTQWGNRTYQWRSQGGGGGL